MRETIAHLTIKVIHESVSFGRSLLLEILQERVSHVSALGKHIIQVAKSVLSRLLLVLDVRMHLLALTVDICNDLPLIGNPRLLLLDQAICDAFDLGSDRVQCIVMVLNPVFLFLNYGCFKLIPANIDINRFNIEKFTSIFWETIIFLTYIRSWL